MLPTHVGMNRYPVTNPVASNHAPHARGDEPKRLSPLFIPCCMLPTHVGMNRQWV